MAGGPGERCCVRGGCWRHKRLWQNNDNNCRGGGGTGNAGDNCGPCSANAAAHKCEQRIEKLQ
eukprot:9969421-Lingulodinium_polyedra.AAC.1